MPRAMYAGIVMTGAIVLSLALLTSLQAQQDSDATIHIGATDLGGVVMSPHGREAGVWVIAEATDLPTKYAKIVVTDNRGRYLIPDLPKATYTVWVRGYGLVDSPEGHNRAGQGPQPEGDRGAEHGRGGAILSGAVLVCHAQGSRQERISRCG